MRVLSPVGVTKYLETKDELTVRPERLTGKVVGILDDGAGKEYQARIKELLMEHEPARIIHRIKPLLSSPAPPQILDEVVRECDVVIVGTGI
jgi:hypothetical protein